MSIEILTGDYFEANCYIVTFSTFAIVIDPCAPLKDILKKANQLPVKGIFLTHGHADHFVHMKEVVEATTAPIYCHKDAVEKIGDENKNYSVFFRKKIDFAFPQERYHFLADGENITIDNTSIKVIYTPGHTNCSVCFVIDDNIFSGDTLFKLGVGRTDLYSANTYSLYASLEKLKHLHKDYKVFPGHGEDTTLQFEIMNNPYLKN